MIPELSGIDHVHIYVSDRSAAHHWYQQVLGFRVMEQYLLWAADGGPLMLEDPAGRVHLALFESDKGPASTIAFGASGVEFLRWKTHLEECGEGLTVSDHDLSWSLYFSDPDGNRHEITTYDYDAVKEQLR